MSQSHPDVSNLKLVELKNLKSKLFSVYLNDIFEKFTCKGYLRGLEYDSTLVSKDIIRVVPLEFYVAMKLKF